MTKLSRRDFLKFIPAVSASLVLSSRYPSLVSASQQLSEKPNIILLVLDAMSARNLSLYGYARETTPHLSRLAERATVYHSHYAAGNYTTPGTASILTGMYPWSHRAINIRGKITHSLLGKDLFSLAGPEYVRVAFTQNMLADIFLRQLHDQIDVHLPLTTFHLNTQPSLVSEKFQTDPLIPYYAFDNPIISYTMVNSLLLNYWNVLSWKDLKQYAAPSNDHPYGTPFNTFNYFHNEVVYEGVRQILLRLAEQGRPFLTYFHLYSPHEPYMPRKEFVDILPEIHVPRKPDHPLARGVDKFTALLEYRKQYDEFIANVDAEVGLLVDGLEQAGILQNTYLFILADHGELFERGEQGHITPLMYDPILHTPLIVYSPGQTTRRDVFSPTSNIDVLPTILQIMGKALPPGMEGSILPGLGGTEEEERRVFSIEAKRNPALAPLHWASTSMMKGHKKLIYYQGYPGYEDSFELYDLQNDLEELDNLVKKDTVTASRMKEELLDMLATANGSLSSGLYPSGQG